MFRQNPLIALSAILSIFIGGYSLADSYIDISYGVTAHSWDVKNTTSGHNSSSNTRVDDEGEGYALILGADLTDSIAGEVSYVNLGETTIIGDDVNDSISLQGLAVDFTGAETITSKTSGFGLGMALHTPSSDTQNFIGSLRAGALMWDSSGTKADATDNDTFVNSVLFENGTDPYIGISAKMSFNSMTVGVAYDSYGLNSFDDTASLMSASLGLIF